MPLITYRQAVNDALAEELTRDENVIILGEEVAELSPPPVTKSSGTVMRDGLE